MGKLMVLNGIQAKVTEWKVIKRDGQQVPFDVERIKKALTSCYKTIGQEEMGSGIAGHVARRVVNVLAAVDPKGWGHKVFDIEEIQQKVIAQLWAEGQVEAAEHYTLYRETRRRQREEGPVDPAHAARVKEDQKRFPSPLQYYQFIGKFARWRPADGRRETWQETVDRVFDWFAGTPGWGALSLDEAAWLKDMMLNFKASPAMRVVQMAGPALERCNVGVYNCAYLPIVDTFSFAELLYILMQGSGVGFSVEGKYIDQLPRIARQRDVEKMFHVVADSTEGWCEAVRIGSDAWINGFDIEFDYSQVRPKDTPLKTKGGLASGPEPLKQLLDFIRLRILAKQGKRLNDLDVHDICCMVGKIVQVGGVRRASEISLSDLDSKTMRDCKHGNWWLENPQRSMSNNSAVYEEKPDVVVFMEEWLALAKARSGERGIFNRDGAIRKRPERRMAVDFGANPCNEIRLRPRQFCNLTIAVVNPGDTLEEIEEKVRAATMFGTLQACCTEFRYIRPDWQRNCEDERLLGVDIMGHLDHPLLTPRGAVCDIQGGRARQAQARHDRKVVLRHLKEVVQECNVEMAGRMGINPSTANTCLKPGGDSGVFFGSSNLSPWFAEFQIRRTRESKGSPVAKMLIDQGVPHEEAAEDSALWAFSWPKRNPEGCITRDQMTAIEQLENWLDWQQCWAEHGCSVTVYVRDHEWFEVGAWCYEHFDELIGVSFLPYDNGTYRTVPNEQLTEEEYNAFVETFPEIDWSKLTRYEKRDTTTSARTYACTGDVCELV